MLKIDSEEQELEEKALQSDVARHKESAQKKSIFKERFDNSQVKLLTLREQLAGAIPISDKARMIPI